MKAPRPPRSSLPSASPSAPRAPRRASLRRRRRIPASGPRSGHLLCPNLRIGTPSEMYVSTYGGKTLLHATSDVESRGRGPMEVHGHRDGPKQMRVTQRIYKAGGGHITLRTGRQPPLHRRRRVLRRLLLEGPPAGPLRPSARCAADGDLGPVLRTSPKLNYCLRDLDRTRPAALPVTRTTPAATRTRASATTSSAPRSAGRHLPADYDKQYIDVSGLRGCFVFR